MKGLVEERLKSFMFVCFLPLKSCAVKSWAR